MKIFSNIKLFFINFINGKRKSEFRAIDFIKHIGPGLIVTVGFIDPGNWATNISAGSNYGYKLLWVVTLSTIMLIVLQHNAAHLGIASGLCLSEATTMNLKPKTAKIVIWSALLATIATAMAEILGASIALNMLFHIPLKLGAIMVTIFVFWMLYINSYKKLEKWIIGFVSIIGLSFIIELALVHIDWGQALLYSAVPNIPNGSILVIMGVIGAVIMPHNLFLHSEIIQSRQWNLENEKIIKRQLKYEFMDTLFSMGIGWAINSAMILLAVSTFFTQHISIGNLDQAQSMLIPLLGHASAIIFALALLFAGVSSTVTAGMAGGSIYAGLYKKSFDIQDRHTKIGVGITLIIGLVVIFFIKDTFQGLIWSQTLLAIQLPITIFTQIYLTSSKKVMGIYANTVSTKIVLWSIAVLITILNILLFASTLY